MAVLTTNSIILLDRLASGKRQDSNPIKIDRAMGGKHRCPCCSNTLLRHIVLGKLYWRCNHCYQSMPVIEDATEMSLFMTYKTWLQQLLILKNPLGEQQNFEHEGWGDSFWLKYLPQRGLDYVSEPGCYL